MDWNTQLLLSSVPLRQIGVRGMPVNFATGCLVNYKDRHVLLTVSHATDNDGNWAIEVTAKDNVGTKLYKMGRMNFLEALNLETEERVKIDFSHVIVPKDILPEYHVLDESYKIRASFPRIIHQINFDLVPNREKKYGFSGNTMFKQDGFILQSINRLVRDLKYIGDEGELYKFKLPIKHPGHEYFRGTSGAPIIDEEGNVIALVSKGKVEEDVILGVPLKKYISSVDVEILESSHEK